MVGGPSIAHGFDFAIVEMKKQVAVYRTGWDPQFKYRLFIEAQQNNCNFTLGYFVLWSSSGDTIPWTATPADLLADDWAVGPAEQT